MRTDPTAGTTMIDFTTPASTPKTHQSPTKLAIKALEGATVSLPTSLHPLRPTLRQQTHLYPHQTDHQGKYCQAHDTGTQLHSKIS